MQEAARKYARYRRMLKHNTMRTEEDAGLPLFTFEKMMILLRYTHATVPDGGGHRDPLSWTR